MRKSPASEWVSVPEAARLKGVTESSVRVAIQTGRLMGGKVGRSYIVRRGDVEAWRPGLRGPKRGRLGEGRAALREAIGAFLAAGGSDEAIRQRILQLRGGAEALNRLARIDEGQRRFAGLGVSTAEYLRWKREEIELEQRRDAAGDA